MESLKCYIVSSLITVNYFPTAHTECDGESEETAYIVQAFSSFFRQSK